VDNIQNDGKQSIRNKQNTVGLVIHLASNLLENIHSISYDTLPTQLTGQVDDEPTLGQACRRLDGFQTGQLTDGELKKITL